MATTIRPEISTKNKYWIDRHRYYELKHFCLQYSMWKRMRAGLDGFSKKPAEVLIFESNSSHGDPTVKCAIAKAYYSERIDMIDKVAVETDSVLGSYILKAITEELSYDYLKMTLNIPCSKDTYYDRYRRFFWLLDKERQ